MQVKRRYTLGESKLAMAYYEGFVQSGSALYTTAENARHFVILDRFRSYESGTKWGRFHCQCILSPGSTLTIYAFAADATDTQADGLNQYFHDSSVPWSQKRARFVESGVCFVNHEDVLLYALAGEYLWIALEIAGSGGAHGIDAGQGERIREMFLDSQGDNFMQTFPEIYQEEGGFFHRYMSVFSSAYQDMADRIADMDRYLDPGTAPMPFLVEMAGWLGFSAEGDFLDENMLRSLIRELYPLNRMKGTKEVIRRLIRMMLGEEPAIVERNRMEGYIPHDNMDTCQRLYGTSMQDVTILLKREGDEKLQAQMMYLLDQFKPARCRIRLVFCPRGDRFDTYCFLDHNAVLSAKREGSMDGGIRMDGTIVLK